MFYITTPIYYVNAYPHLGTTYTTVLADVIYRYHKLSGEDSYFLTGTDEHGINIQRIAEKNHTTPQKHCDEYATIFQDTWKRINIINDDFIRTSQDRHISVVQQIFEDLFNRGMLYKDVYQGWYCSRCESYYQDDELLDNNCPVHNVQLDLLEEETFFFTWSKFQQKLLDFYEKHPEFVIPESRYREVTSFVERGLKDISVSRANVQWGIPVISSPQHTIYVWMDALINYLSAVGYKNNDTSNLYYWPPTVQVIGKDILRQHAIFWPALLMALDLPLPQHILVHEYFLVTGAKMSKSGGNVFNPIYLMEELINISGVSQILAADVLRYFLVKDGPEKVDTDFNLDSFLNRYKTDLANDWGNLINRTYGLMQKNYISVINRPATLLDSEVFENIKRCIDNYHHCFRKLSPKEALAQINQIIKYLNTFIDYHRPWSKPTEERENCLYQVLEGIRIIALLLLPIMPASSSMILKSLNISTEKVSFSSLHHPLSSYAPIFTDLPILFPRSK